MGELLDRHHRCRRGSFAADMAGIGYITAFHADVARNNILIDAHILEAASQNSVSHFFYASSACIYPMFRQTSPTSLP